MRQALLILMGIIVSWTMPAFSSARHDGAATTQAADVDAPLDRANPVQVGDAEPAYWGPLPETSQAEATRTLKAFARKAASTLEHPLHLQESRLFLLYSDLPSVSAAHYGALLEQMYGKLEDFFGIEKDNNLFRGKALVFVFARVEDYRLFERLVENCDPGGSYGMTHCFGDGMVHMAFYRYPNEALFAHLLVHESVHAFLHRYKTPVRIPSWANEGLADELATELIPNPRSARFNDDLARLGLQRHGGQPGDLFTARHIDGWQYPIAETLCAWMIRQNRQGYLDFIDGIKSGQDWEKSLKANFNATPERLVAEYKKALLKKPAKP